MTATLETFTAETVLNAAARGTLHIYANPNQAIITLDGTTGSQSHYRQAEALSRSGCIYGEHIEEHIEDWSVWRFHLTPEGEERQKQWSRLRPYNT